MTTQMNKVIQHLRHTLLVGEGTDLTDGQLLECFVSRREPAALETLVRRHGPMVWSVCHRILASHHDAEDAFQATFLVLVRKAESIKPREMVANWLYGVAHQTALKARAAMAKLGARERQVVDMPEPIVKEPDLSCELVAVLDQELSRLPDMYRVAIVMCDLEGTARKEAARQLGLPEGTVAGRLTRGRAMLAKRLARHGLPVAGGTLAATLSQQAASGAVPTSVLASTIKAVTAVAAGQVVAAGVITVKAIALTEGVVKAMFLTKLRNFTAVILLVSLCTGIGRWVYVSQAAEPVLPQPTPDKEPSSRKLPEDVPENRHDEAQDAGGNVAPKKPARLKVVLRVNEIGSREVQNLLSKIPDDLNKEISMDAMEIGPSADLQAQIRITKDTPRKTIVRLVDALLEGGVFKISIGDSFRDDGTVNPIKSKENLEGRWFAKKDNGMYERLDIQADRLTWSYGQETPDGGAKESYNRFSYTLDPTKTPKELDLVALDGISKDRTYPCVYQLNGDTLRICMSQPAKERPTTLEGDKGSSHRSLTLKRVSP